MFATRLLPVLMSTLLLTACATQTKPDPVSAFEKAMVHDRVIVSGQPTKDDLANLKERGITHIFNVRAPEEMSTLGFDESALASADGIAYSNQPIGGATAYTPELLEAFAETMAASDGKVLLHCGSGGRAAVLYAAYAMKYLGLTPDEAMRTMSPTGAWPLPLERMTGEKLTVVRSDALKKAGFEKSPSDTD
ncbi:MAG: dual specificity protein phosphatase family protein [Ahniella sp.]|nr:dual specificity protein phosphatase family protein [Ahniella sp.]